MRALALTLAAAMLLPACATAADRKTPAEELAEMLKGRQAGEPVNCLQLNQIRGTTIIDDTAIVYRTTRGLLYVNRPRGGGQGLDRDDILVTKTNLNQLCSMDIVHLYERGGNFMTGSVSLGEFVPYRKPKD